MNELILSPIPLTQLEDSIAKILDEKLQAYLPVTDGRSTSKKFATRREISQLLHISLPTLNELTKAGSLAAYRIGGRVLYDIAEVESSLKQIVATKYKRKL